MRKIRSIAVSLAVLAPAVVAGTAGTSTAETEPSTDVDPALDGQLPAWVEADLALETAGLDDGAAPAPAPDTSVATMLSARRPDVGVPAATGPLLVSGVVHAPDPVGGSGQTGEVVVYLADELDPSAGGVSAPSPIARLVIGATGSFSANPALAGRIDAALDGGDEVNLMVTGTFRGRGFVRHIVRKLDRAGGRWLTSDDDPDVAEPISAAMVLEALPPALVAAPSSSRQYVGCTSRTISSYQVAAVVGEVHLSQRFAGGTFSYGSRADTEMGMAVKEGTKAWAVEGSRHVSRSASVSNSFPLNADEHRLIYGNFEMRDVKVQCSTGYTVDTWIEARPQSFNGGVRRGPTVPARYCGGEQTKYRQQIEANGVFTRQSDKAQTWSGGATVHGVSVSSRSGYSTSVMQTWKAGKKPTWVCGSNANPSHSKRIFTSSSIR